MQQISREFASIENIDYELAPSIKFRSSIVLFVKLCHSHPRIAGEWPVLTFIICSYI
jgi:hypothetical protein